MLFVTSANAAAGGTLRLCHARMARPRPWGGWEGKFALLSPPRLPYDKALSARDFPFGGPYPQRVFHVFPDQLQTTMPQLRGNGTDQGRQPGGDESRLPQVQVPLRRRGPRRRDHGRDARRAEVEQDQEGRRQG